MKVTLQATGYAPVEFDAADTALRSHQDMDERRGVAARLWKLSGGGWVAALDYNTTWGSERSFTRVFDAPALVRSSFIPPMAAQLRDAAKTILPPGAGYPAMPEYATRQAKLRGQLETLTLIAISEVLAAARERGEQL